MPDVRHKSFRADHRNAATPLTMATVLDIFELVANRADRCNAFGVVQDLLRFLNVSSLARTISVSIGRIMLVSC